MPAALPQLRCRCRFPEETYDWEMDQPLKHPYDETILYRLHVRGFTRHTSSGTGERGTFRALTEKIPYLKELGITAVELMMPNEFQEVMMEDVYEAFGANRYPAP